VIFEKKMVALVRGATNSRHDDTGDVFYYSPADFEGLLSEKFDFVGESGQTLAGAVYYMGERSAERLVIFDHGMGAGYRAYMQEIVMLTKSGFTVLTYDHTGCRDSEGEGTQGFAQSLSDLDYCIRAVKADPVLSKLSLSVVGHSWGAFSAMNISAIHKDITHVVAMSGFVSVKIMLGQFLAGPMKLFLPAAYAAEAQAVPNYVQFDARTSLRDSDAAVLLIYSDNDKTVKLSHHFELLREALSYRPKTELLLVHGKGHNPNYTAEAVAYKDAFFKALTKARKRGMLKTEEEKTAFKNSYDWAKMTEQDTELWDKIIDFLSK